MMEEIRVPEPLTTGQQPTVLPLQGLHAQPWWNLSVASILEASVVEITKEYCALRASKGEENTSTGEGNPYYLMEEGNWNAANCALCPLTAKLTKSLPICESSLGHAYFSVISPGSVGAPSSGSTNGKLRIQLPLLGFATTTPVPVGGGSPPSAVATAGAGGAAAGAATATAATATTAATTAATTTATAASAAASATAAATKTTTTTAAAAATAASAASAAAVADDEPRPRKVLKGITITVAGETRTYEEGRAIVFDDSYIHSIRHRSRARNLHVVVLQVDIWHPDLNPLSINKITSVFNPRFSYTPYERSEAERGKNEIRLKYFVTGPSFAGKTKFVTRLATDSFDDSYLNTIGIDFMIRRVMYHNLPLLLQLWDSTGIQRFTISRSYYRGSMGIFVGFDLSDAESFVEVDRFIDEVVGFSRDQPVKSRPYLMLVGFKSDLPRRVEHSQAVAKAVRNGMMYAECSSREEGSASLVLAAMLKESTRGLVQLKVPEPGGAAVDGENAGFRQCSIM